MENNEKQVEAQGVETKKQKPSKTAVLSSIRTLKNNLIALGWGEMVKLNVEALEGKVKEQIIKEL